VREVLLQEAYFRMSLRADYAEAGQSLSAYDFRSKGTAKNGIFAQSVHRLVLRNNHIYHYGERPNSHPENDHAIRLIHCNEVKLEGNTFDQAGISVGSRP